MGDNNLNEYHDPNEQNITSLINFQTFQTEQIYHSKLKKKINFFNLILLMLFITMIVFMLSIFLILFFKFSKEIGKN